MNQLLAVDSLDFHEYPVGFTTTFELTYGKGLTSLRRTLVDNAEFGRGMLFKKVSENKFCPRIYLLKA